MPACREKPARSATCGRGASIAAGSGETQPTRHRIGERFGVRARSVLGGLHHEFVLVPALA